MTDFEQLNRPQIRRDTLRDLAERFLRAATWITALAGGAYVVALFLQTLEHLNRSW